MSLASESHIYRNMISEEINENQCSENSTEYLFVQECENIEETLVVGEEIEVNEDFNINEETSVNDADKINETQVYVDENFDIHSEIAIDYNAEASSECTSDITIKHELPNNIGKSSPMVTDVVKCESEEDINESLQQEQDVDEETIATFVTANGQQLALYAVEDSEDIFAVAVYDESGEPPTNFEFLMKSDVERLIGEGAVRTVKKPTQIKKQLLTTHDTPLLLSEEESTLDTSNINEKKVIIPDIQKNVEKQDSWNESLKSIEDSEMSMKLTSDLIYSNAQKESDVTYIMMDESTNFHNSEEKDMEADHELVEQSTVQYILFEQDQSDSELTFDEIQATLENLKSSEIKPSRTINNKKQTNSQYDAVKITSLNSFNYEYDHNSYDVSNNLCDVLTQKHLTMLKDRQDLLDVLMDNVSITNSDITKQSLLNSSLESESPIEIKVKRSRKQQLTSVNREDSEIIIQPASFLTEEEEIVIRKRGKRKRRILPYANPYQRTRESRRLRKIRRRREVEVIEIDIDEDERTRKEIVEITLDDNKDKCSSDKENEVIMVGDSDDESNENGEKSSSPVLKCEFCLRNFRQRRALDTHLRVCSKSPSNALKLSPQKLKETDSETVKKVYSCKICQEKFDVVVALARHVRSEHSQRKKRQMSKTLAEQEPEETVPNPEPPQKEHNTIPKNPQRKRKSQHSTTIWDAKKLNCTDCGRWFPSTALLKAHCLQHATKKSEQQVRRCQLCKKLIKSRMLFIRHLRMHSKMKQSTNSVKTTLEKKLRTTRQTCRISTVRKRGRPRKL